jgi:hypothetical protein
MKYKDKNEERAWEMFRKSVGPHIWTGYDLGTWFAIGVFIGVMIVAPFAFANAADVNECQKDYDLALSVMQQRQKDNNLIEAMQSFTNKKLVMSAYSQPQQKTIPLRIEATKNFANHSAQKCFKWSIL